LIWISKRLNEIGRGGPHLAPRDAHATIVQALARAALTAACTAYQLRFHSRSPTARVR
jgi:hypothetical protein